MAEKTNVQTNTKQKKRSLQHDLHALWRAVKLTQKLEPKMLPLLACSALCEAANPFVGLYFSARIVDGLLSGAAAETIVPLILWTLGLTLFFHLLGKGLSRAREVVEERLYYRELHLVDAVFLKTDYENLENPCIQNLARDYREGVNMRGANLAYALGDDSLRPLLQGAFTIVFAAVFALPLFFAGGDAAAHPFLAGPGPAILMTLAILCSVFLSLFISRRGMQKSWALARGMLRVNRNFQYVVGRLITQYQSGKELRLYREQGLFGRFISRALNTCTDLLKKETGCEARYEGLAAGISALLSGLSYLFVALKALTGAFGAGMVIQYAGAITRFTTGLTDFAGAFSNALEQVPFLEDLYAILDLKPVLYSGTLPVEKRDDNDYVIEFHHVSFRYPGASEWALRDLSMQLKVGKHLAVVGRNGSGKTTFIKLLCRLYDPTEGEITLNGIDIRKYRYEEYLAIFSVVFQDFALFSFPLGQNVAASTEVDEPCAKKCLDEAGFSDRLRTLPKGLATPLYKNFDPDGVEVSGGEAQKIAIARALYKNAPFVVLDEPTAALDPLSEAEIYERFGEMVGDRTAVYISHRLSSCRFCDDIAVFDRGQIVQRGSHETLLSQKGSLYEKLWNAQAQYYATHSKEDEIYLQ